MRVTIVRENNAVTIDGATREVDCSGVDSDIRVIQWIDETGWLEFVNGLGEPFRVNQPIDDIGPYQYLIDAWGDVGEETSSVLDPVPVTDHDQELEKYFSTEIKSDFDREMFVSFLRISGPEVIKSNINQTVNDLDDVKRYLAQLTLLVAAVIRK